MYSWITADGKYEATCGDPTFSGMALGDSANTRITQEQAAQASGEPCKYFAIGNLKAAIQSILLMLVFLKKPSPRMSVEKSCAGYIGVLPTLINDVKTTALFSVLKTEDVFCCKGLEEPILHSITTMASATVWFCFSLTTTTL